MDTLLRALGVVRLTFVIVLALLAWPILAPVAAQEQATPMAAAAMTAEDAIAAVTVSDGMLSFDVAEDATKFVFDPDHVHDDGLPAYGSSFVTRAYIYPGGTLTDSNGVNADGSPEFPDQVLGEWVCRGWFVGDGAHTTSGPLVVTTQVYNFGDGVGQATLISDGYELADVSVMIDRAITGGTGPFAGAGGVAHQTLLGLNATEGVNLHFEIELEAAGT